MEGVGSSMSGKVFLELFSTYQTNFHPSSSFPFGCGLTLDILIAIFFCTIVALFLFILYHMLMEICPCFFEVMRGQQELEERAEADHADVSNSSQQDALLQIMIQTNLQVLSMLETAIRDLEERRGNRRIAMSNLPPLVDYGSHDDDQIRRSCVACTICLEEFKSGEPCQAFPVCKHVFHSNCINDWLKKKLTCPVCRYCIKDQ